MRGMVQYTESQLVRAEPAHCGPTVGTHNPATINPRETTDKFLILSFAVWVGKAVLGAERLELEMRIGYD
jgi:hypothetical protein